MADCCVCAAAQMGNAVVAVNRVVRTPRRIFLRKRSGDGHCVNDKKARRYMKKRMFFSHGFIEYEFFVNAEDDKGKSFFSTIKKVLKLRYCSVLFKQLILPTIACLYYLLCKWSRFVFGRI